MANAFYFILKPFFVLKIFRFLSWVFGHVEKAAGLEIINFKIYDVTDRLTKNYNPYIAQYLTKQNQPDNEICSVNII